MVAGTTHHMSGCPVMECYNRSVLLETFGFREVRLVDGQKA